MRSHRVFLIVLATSCISALGCAARETEEESAGAASAAAPTSVTCTSEEGFAGRELSALTGLAVGAGSASLDGLVLRPFTTDGCSVVPDGVPGSPAGWQACCVAHDIEYWLGGTREEKRRADEALDQCIRHVGYSSLGRLFEAGVRAMGGPSTDQTYRWGYGWNGPRGYAPLTSGELAQAERLHGTSDRESLRTRLAATPVVPPCDTYDPAMNGLRPEELAAYEHLRGLNADVIEWARWGYFNRAEKQLDVKLASCPRPVTMTFSIKGELLTSERCEAR